MGTLILPSSGQVYLDTNTIIYAVEKHPLYSPVLQPLWQGALSKKIEVVSSDLVLMETLIGPFKSGDSTLALAYEQALLGTDMRLIPISQSILRKAAQLRAHGKMKTPDAIHATTALETGCTLFVSNDAGLRTVAGLPLVVLDELLQP